MKIKNPGMIFLVPSQFLGNSYPTQEGTRHNILPSLTFKKILSLISYLKVIEHVGG